MQNIELIGSIDTKRHYQSSDIAELLAVDRTALHVGTEFMGRPDTRIYVNKQNVVKIRAELDLNNVKAHRWVTNILQQEQKLAVYHPHKTWFILSETDTVLVGSICPRLRPLHLELTSPPASQQEQSRYLTILHDMFQQYFQLAKKTGFKLDEGLSNFAIDEQNKVYYLDDEYYSWDNFVAFAVMQGVLLRSFSWLDKEFIRQLAGSVVNLIDDIYQDPHCRVIISTQLQSVFMPTQEKQKLLTEYIHILSKTPISTTKKRSGITNKNSNKRYFAVMADVHANEAALDSVLDFYKQQNIDQGIVLGDIVGYGPDPRICIEKLQESSFEVIKGNHDHAVAMANTDKGFSRNAKVVVDWTIKQLDESHREWLKYLPSFSRNKDWFAVHGAPMDPTFLYGYVYLMTAEDNLNYLQEHEISLCFHGHSHMPGIYARDKYKRDHHLTDDEVSLTKYKHMLICPGSVGQPRNGNLSAQCAVYDREKALFNFINIPYSVDSTVQRMKDNKLPEQFWQRLQTGK